MIADKMKALVRNSSAIRAMFEEGKIMGAMQDMRMCVRQ